MIAMCRKGVPVGVNGIRKPAKLLEFETTAGEPLRVRGDLMRCDGR